MQRSKPFVSCLAAALILVLGGCAHLPPDEPSDPLEVVNRGVFKFNQTADKYVLRPVATGYRNYLPGPVRNGVSNVLSNLFYPTVIVNDFLQGKFVQGGKDVGRFFLNSTVGLAGILDVATPVGLPENDEDLGQTLGRWGVGEGWYLMIPLLGPTTVRDGIGRIGDTFTAPPTYMNDEGAIAINVVNVVDTRAGLLDADKFLEESFDPYLFLRTAYLQRRQNLVFDGNPPKPEYDFDDFDDE